MMRLKDQFLISIKSETVADRNHFQELITLVLIEMRKWTSDRNPTYS